MGKFLSALVVGAAVCLSFAAISNSGPAARRLLRRQSQCRRSPHREQKGRSPPSQDSLGRPAGRASQEGRADRFKADFALWSAITFVIFLFLLGRFAWRPLIKQYGTG